jgi:hypothetical protein
VAHTDIFGQRKPRMNRPTLVNFGFLYRPLRGSPLLLSL